MESIFKRCVFYFMIGMYGLSFIAINEMLGGSAILFYIGFLLFVVFTFVFFIEIALRFVKLVSNENEHNNVEETVGDK